MITRKMENINCWAFSLVLLLSKLEGLNPSECFSVLMKSRSFARSFWYLACHQESKLKDVTAFLT